MKESVASFLSNILAVILGIFITFTIQGMIDRSRDRKNARSSLELVRAELVRNIDDVSIIKEYLDMEKQSAAYLIANKDSLDKCPDDSISYHSGILFADVSMSLSMDACTWIEQSLAASLLAGTEWEPTTSTPVHIGRIVFGVTIIFMAQIFYIGREMQEEQELTI